MALVLNRLAVLEWLLSATWALKLEQLHHFSLSHLAWYRTCEPPIEAILQMPQRLLRRQVLRTSCAQTSTQNMMKILQSTFQPSNHI
ncbi:hypothetical protein EMPG_14776 [Blastomyces silverae]|uniref:Secreted protein n=1 Tax=Blastomyces silverae TaxID=2060906 RepID=A0A0H1BFM9_9EURO|nr:hypothetical protein EMPG_14776 [Blastomyces silverae]